MKRFVVIPLAVTMLAALAVPVLAASDTVTQTGAGTSFEVLGKYSETSDEPSVYSVDIEWGSMKATYKKYTATSKWNPKTHEFDNFGSSGYGVWEWADSDNGLKGNEIKLTNHSAGSIKCTFLFQPNEAFSGSGSFEGVTNDQLTFAAGQGRSPTDPTLTKNTSLTLTGSVPNSYSDYQALGTVSITISDH